LIESNGFVFLQQTVTFANTGLIEKDSFELEPIPAYKYLLK
jgi:hypothetical protein